MIEFSIKLLILFISLVCTNNKSFSSESISSEECNHINENLYDLLMKDKFIYLPIFFIDSQLLMCPSENEGQFSSHYCSKSKTNSPIKEVEYPKNFNHFEAILNNQLEHLIADSNSYNVCKDIFNEHNLLQAINHIEVNDQSYLDKYPLRFITRVLAQIPKEKINCQLPLK